MDHAVPHLEQRENEMLWKAVFSRKTSPDRNNFLLKLDCFFGQILIKIRELHTAAGFQSGIAFRQKLMKSMAGRNLSKGFKFFESKP